MHNSSQSRHLYIGLMSGTSLDAVDAVLVDFSSQTPVLLASHAIPLHSQYREQVNALIEKPNWTLYGQVNTQMALLSAQAVNELLEQQISKKDNITRSSITAIGSHGQTIWHQPTGSNAFTLQLGDPNRIAALTGIPVVADCRGKDIAYGGQGAPLVPAFHQAVLTHPLKTRVVANIGGIANVTLLPKADKEAAQTVVGYDTGPGNGLMNAWMQRKQNVDWDEAGKCAASGTTHTHLLENMLSDDYFAKPAPKSTGREYFNWAWLQNFDDIKNLSIADVQSTLCDLTATSLAKEVRHLQAEEMLLCGGGVHNLTLVNRLKTLLPDVYITTTDTCGLPADWLEAMAFAWLAKQRITEQPGNLTSVTGARQATTLGAVYLP